MSDKQLPVSISYRVNEEGKLEPDGLANVIRQDAFLKSIKKGEKFEITYDHINDNANYSQFAMVHACIREIARDTGHSFEEIKKEVKKRAGLYTEKDKLRSFSVCSKVELGSAIEACLALGDELGINLHQF